MHHSSWSRDPKSDPNLDPDPEGRDPCHCPTSLRPNLPSAAPAKPHQVAPGQHPWALRGDSGEQQSGQEHFQEGPTCKGDM